MSDMTFTFGAKDDGVNTTIMKIKGSLDNLERSTKQTSQGFDTGFKGMAIAGGAAGLAVAAGMKVIGAATDAARAVVGKFGDALDMGGRLTDLSSRTGETAGKLLVLERAFDNTGVGADKVGTSINKLQKFMQDAANGGEKQAETLATLGISMQDLQGKTPTEQMQVFAQKIAGIQDPTERAALAMTVFGKSGGQLLPLLNNFSGELNAAKGQLGSMPGVMDKTAAAFDLISDNLAAGKTKLTEFAAGLIQGAAPALEKFTAMLSGVDAAGYGQKMGEMLMRLTDILLGAFKSPMPAIEAIGLALNAHIRNMGNLYLNAFITGASFLRDFWTSEMPNLILERFGNYLKLAYANSLKFFVDGLLSVAKFFNQDFGAAVSNVIEYFGKAFSTVIKLMATDLFQAITNPLGFVAGKIKSVLTDSINDGGLTFKSVFSQGIDSSLGKLSNGLGQTAETYGRDLDQSTIKIGAEWDKITGNLKTSSKDFFGAEPATNRLTDKLKEVEDSGRKFREQLTQGTGQANGDTKGIEGNLQSGADAMTNAAAKVKEALSMSQQITEDINKAEKENDIDKGGKKKKKIDDLIEEGKFEKARRENEKIANKERDQELRGAGKDKDNRSVKDIAKDEGIDTFRKNNQQLREEILKKREEDKKREQAENQKKQDDAAKKRQEEMKPGNEGKKDTPKDQGKDNGIGALSGVVSAILIEIKNRLPQSALGY